MKTLKTLAFALAIGCTTLAAFPVLAAEEVTIVIKDHKFEPARVEVPVGKKIKLIIDNQDATPEEFESHELKREKVIQGNSQGVVLIGPLESGEYPFFGEFNEATAQGVIVATVPGESGDSKGADANGVEASGGPTSEEGETKP